ncbi:cupin-like domain-containing protein [Cystobacter ferrugineus]|uniref:JmjC domain-containing protein n=1 Tax=Cystobacter ferrugineus TaxID=83449 RepID=A0A1L9BF19_9BACT|nr:cupin-like domain-containing protein [Cystobacter ferrugineus]OJH40862.1 hypothetical protein BON30_08015 [Cystobacter ferrugineus]
MASPVVSVSRVQRLPKKIFERDFLARVPLVLTDALSHWPALRTWSWELLRERCGERRVRVEVYEDGNRASMWAYRDMTLANYLDVMNGEEHRKYYLAERPLHEVFPELLGDLGDLVLVESERLLKQVTFMGRDSFSTLHYHPRDEALTVQVLGTKRFLLYPPWQTELLYPYPWYSPRSNFSSLPLDGTLPRERYPRFDEATPLEVVLRPGEMIYIPVGWWHSVEGEGQTLTLTSFWRSALQHWLGAPFGWRDAFNLPVMETLRLMDRSARKLGLQKPAYRLAEKLGLIDDAGKMTTYEEW